MMTVSREILMHPDFMTNLADELCTMLETIIDAEFEKGDDTDFDFIDECADAINAIRSGDSAQVLPVISRKDFLKKVGIKGERKIKTTPKACYSCNTGGRGGLNLYSFSIPRRAWGHARKIGKSRRGIAP